MFFFFFLLASLWRRFSRCLNPVVNVRHLVLISVTPPYAFLTMLCHWKSLKEYVVLFALTSFVSAFKTCFYFSDLRISWDLFFFVLSLFLGSSPLCFLTVKECLRFHKCLVSAFIWVKALHGLLPYCTNKSLQSQLSGVLLISLDPIFSCFWQFCFAFQFAVAFGFHVNQWFSTAFRFNTERWWDKIYHTKNV